MWSLLVVLYKLSSYAFRSLYYSMMRQVREYRQDVRYRIDTLSTDLKHLEVGRCRHNDAASYYQTDYGLLHVMLERLPLGKDDVFFDVGCGKGRVSCLVGQRGVKKIVGIDILARHVETARRNYRRARPRPTAPAEFHVADVAEFDMNEGTVYYLFNPFGAYTFDAMLRGIRDGLAAFPRRVRIVYFTPVHRALIAQHHSDWLEEDKTAGIPDMIVWKNRLLIAMLYVSGLYVVVRLALMTLLSVPIPVVHDLASICFGVGYIIPMILVD